MKYSLFGNFLAHDGNRDELLEILLKASELLKKNPDCIHYIVSTSSDQNLVWVYETWANKEAHDKALEPEELRSLIKKAMPLIKKMAEQTQLTVAGGVGV